MNCQTGRIHMVAGQPVRVLYNPLFTDIHQDGLAADRADVVRQVLGRHARRAVVLRAATGSSQTWVFSSLPPIAAPSRSNSPQQLKP